MLLERTLFRRYNLGAFRVQRENRLTKEKLDLCHDADAVLEGNRDLVKVRIVFDTPTLRNRPIEIVFNPHNDLAVHVESRIAKIMTPEFIVTLTI